jgi:hypothetical protein
MRREFGKPYYYAENRADRTGARRLSRVTFDGSRRFTRLPLCL